MKWIVREQGINTWTGIWVRRGTTNVFDGTWTKTTGDTKISEILTITIDGDQVKILRGKTCTYTGTMRGRNASGTMIFTDRKGDFTWSATVH